MEIFDIKDEDAVSESTAIDWYKRLCDGNINDEDRFLSDRPVQVYNEST